MVDAPTPPFIQAKYHGGYQTPRRITMHGTVSPCEPGGARSVARYFQHPAYVSSAHYVVDPGGVIQCVGDNTVAWHDGVNKDSIGIEMCDWVEGPLSRWNDTNHQEMLHRSAALTRQLCLYYGIPMEWSATNGIATHAEIVDYYGVGNHWDPGQWPADEFMRLVRGGSTITPVRKKEKLANTQLYSPQGAGTHRTGGDLPSWDDIYEAYLSVSVKYGSLGSLNVYLVGPDGVSRSWGVTGYCLNNAGPWITDVPSTLFPGGIANGHRILFGLPAGTQGVAVDWTATDEAAVPTVHLISRES